ncbi:hypothetical protein RHMOL_Rhmol07G0017300 [Rhododendron molle]|uniref:Uncharacterized protein n=1 Tax=Rhododendron molle TaxID=49168 RepID=A0ACC0MXA0_RHOML|nr:hypothetical protein RHMOL_Rhmol07G0017300 [Rhododendron molle]
MEHTTPKLVGKALTRGTHQHKLRELKNSDSEILEQIGVSSKKKKKGHHHYLFGVWRLGLSPVKKVGFEDLAMKDIFK